MSQTYTNWDNYGNSRRHREPAPNARAELILSRAERRVAPASSRSMAREPVKIDNMDKLALALAILMTLAPLAAAAFGSLMVS